MCGSYVLSRESAHAGPSGRFVNANRIERSKFDKANPKLRLAHGLSV
jgi:hypothetical protein